MTLHEYLMSDQAREDVRALVDGREEFVGPGGLCIIAGPEGKWRAMTAIDDAGDEVLARVYYRPDGDRFVVTDLGEGVRAACLRGLDLANAEHFERLNALGRTLDADFRQTAPLGWIELRDITAADLPDAICRVMLASLRVMEAAL